MNLFEVLRRLAVIVWAIALALLVPVFFFNYGGQWLHKIAALWPLSHP